MNPDDIQSLLSDTWADLQQPKILWQWLIVASCVTASWLIAWILRRGLRARAQRYIDRDPERNAQRLKVRYDGLEQLFMPFFAWALLFGAERMSRAYRQPWHLVRIFAILAIAYVGIQLGLYAMRRVFKPSPGLFVAQRWFGLLAWLLVALHVVGILPDVVAALSGPEASFTIGKNVSINLWQIVSAIFWVGITLVAALWAGATLESRLMHSETLDGSMRIVLARLGKAVLIVIAILVAMRLVDIDITVLSVFGGALGVGLGLGLQRIASNYVSGFIILLDRSLRIGDVITIDKYNGTVTQIRTRCTVVRSLNGVEALVPNELLLNQPVLNFSDGDKNGNAVTRIRVAYDTDIDRALQLMLDAAKAQTRVLESPAPTAILRDFAPEGIELELTVWVPDPETGTDATRSDINRRLWSAFQQAGIKVAVPRDVDETTLRRS